MMSDDLTIRILTEIRDEIRSTNHRLDQTNQLLDQTRTELADGLASVRTELTAGLASVRAELRASELRVATRTVEQTAATRDLYDRLIEQQLRNRVEQCERDIDELKNHVQTGHSD